MMNLSLEPNVEYLKNNQQSPTHLHNANPSNFMARTAKDLKTFEISNLNHDLPPNTGPPGTVPVNSNNGNGNNNKNLSHVPCKFFKQGICQAGESCPFSHNLDGSLGADKLPCKYFQKGNCKFGLKCALAHYLPDGTRVNHKNFGNKRYHNNHHNNYTTNNQFSNGSNSIPTMNNANGMNNITGNISALSLPLTSFNQMNLLQSQPIDIESITPPNNQISFKNNSISLDINGSNSFQPTNSLNGTWSNSFGSASGSNSASNFTFHSHSNSSIIGNNLNHNTGSNNNNGNNNGNINIFGNNTGINTNYSAPNSAVNTTPNSNSMFRSYSSNTSPTTFYNSNASTSPQSQSNFFINNQFIQSPNNLPPNLSIGKSNMTSGPSHSHSQSSSSPFNNNISLNNYPNSNSFGSYSNQLQESAIMDDEVEKDSNITEDVFEEDYVPASLSDIILTPQELQRRDSRSQSGTLLVRPNLISSHDADIKENNEDSVDANKHSPTHEDVFLMD